MAKIDKTYHKLLNKILKKGYKYEDPNRKNINRIEIPSYQIKHDFKHGFPAITTKKLYWKGIVGELLWFLRGDTNIKYLVDNNINIWNKDAYNYYLESQKKYYPNENIKNFNTFVDEIKVNSEKDVRNFPTGLLGRVYGAQWRKFGKYSYDIENGYDSYVDQISNLIKGLKENPMGTRHIVTAWNPAELNDMALPPCHWSFEILVEPLKYIKSVSKDIYAEQPKYQFTLKWHQRSVDTFLGLPFNIASYALLAQMIGKLTNMKPKRIIGDLSNVHIYEPHLDAVKKQLSRDVNKYDGLKTKVVDFHDIKEHYEDKGLDNLLNELDISENFILKNYESYSSIKAKMFEVNK